MDKRDHLYGHKCLLILLLAREAGSTINVTVRDNQKKPKKPPQKSGAVLQSQVSIYCRAVTAPKILIHFLIGYLLSLKKKKKGAIFRN